ncbi:hypothetical protein NLG97_g978 [Lecanicillium saksenae]|uniref:Uncharacterized protein n=1 Tax=Lecanicillium saksenae TaxID=468837 RepID=A0ACC1R586_9HYPO|nr:hypothetical protein NLG97_g978 [Lecanicillium saksenae]
MPGSWLFDHDPEAYARDNYDKALAHLVDGTPFQNTNKPANIEYQPWTIEGLMEAQERGKRTILDGDWKPHSSLGDAGDALKPLCCSACHQRKVAIARSPAATARAPTTPATMGGDGGDGRCSGHRVVPGEHHRVAGELAWPLAADLS